jgi:hypothetical protein
MKHMQYTSLVVPSMETVPRLRAAAHMRANGHNANANGIFAPNNQLRKHRVSSSQYRLARGELILTSSFIVMAIQLCTRNYAILNLCHLAVMCSVIYNSKASKMVNTLMSLMCLLSLSYSSVRARNQTQETELHHRE